MKALTWHGKNDIRCESVPDPKIEHGRDAIIKVTACAICGSDLHLFDGVMPSMEKGDVLGHETMGEVVEVGTENKKLKVGDRVVVPFTISCGECFFCKKGFFSGCERSNPNHKMAEKLWGHSPAGLFGYSHMLGGYAGGQAEYLRVPYADVGPIKVPQGLERRTGPLPVGHLSHGLYGGGLLQSEGRRNRRDLGLRSRRPVRDQERVPAGCRAGDRHRHRPGASRSSSGIRRHDARFQEGRHLRSDPGANRRAGRGRLHRCRRHGTGHRLRLRCRNRPSKGRHIHGHGSSARAAPGHPLLPQFGTVSIVGVYGGLLDKIPMGSAINRGLTFRMAQTPVQHYLPQLFERIEKGEIDPSFVVTHRATLEEGPELYKTFRAKKDGCIKVVMKP